MRREVFRTPGALRLEVRNVAGSVDVRTVDGEETVVEIESSSEIEQDALVDLRETGGGHELVVAVESEKRFLFVRVAPDVHIRVTCPHGVRADVKGVSADVRLHGRLSDVHAKTVSGDVQVGQVDGGLDAKTVSGDVSAGEVGGRAVAQSVSGDVELRRVVGPVELKTVSGDARVDEAGSSVEGQTVSGDVRLSSVGEGSVRLRTVSGDLTIGVRPGSKVWLDVSSKSGETVSELPVGDAPSQGEGPSLELRATALSGDIKISRASS